MEQYKAIGFIGKAREANFRAEILQVKERLKEENLITDMAIQIDNVTLTSIDMDDAKKWETSLKSEIVYYGNYQLGVNKLTSSYIKSEFENIIKGDNDKAKDIYYIDIDEVEKKTYIYNKETDIVFKIKSTKLYGEKVHSIEELDFIINGGEREKTKQYTKINYVVDLKENLGYYEPNINGFGLEVTSLIFYKKEENSVTEDIYEMSASEWLDREKPNEIEKDDSTYVLYDYENRIWANIKVVNDGIETWWVWIPRYAYKNDGTTTNVIFIDIYNEKNGEKLPEGYTVQSAFEGNIKKGILVSKYEPTNVSRTVSTDFAYYVPDLTGFDKNNTYIEIYDKESGTFSKEVKASEIENLSEFANKNLWYDYDKKIWANVKVEINGIETWWVWIPRYAYRNDGNSTEVIFIDKNNKPLNGEELPNTYTIQSAFEGNEKLGIWVSKYEPTAVSNKYVTNINTVPDLTGFDKENTYLEIYNKRTETFSEEKKLSEISDLEKFAEENLWYDYRSRIYANIKVVENGIETWWVWIPRYAYRNDNTTTDVILIDENNKQLNGEDLPSTYTVQSAFEGNSKKGIWVSKYQPTEN